MSSLVVEGVLRNLTLESIPLNFNLLLLKLSLLLLLLKLLKLLKPARVPLLVELLKVRGFKARRMRFVEPSICFYITLEPSVGGSCLSLG